jgi:Bacterial SH3 domain
MNFAKSVATVGFALSLSVITIGGLAAQTSAPPPAPASSTASDTGNKPIKPMKERYLVSHSSAVYAQADTSSAVIGHVYRKKHVTVTGLEGDWLRVRLPHGKVGYIPAKAAE